MEIDQENTKPLLEVRFQSLFHKEARSSFRLFRRLFMLSILINVLIVIFLLLVHLGIIDIPQSTINTADQSSKNGLMFAGHSYRSTSNAINNIESHMDRVIRSLNQSRLTGSGAESLLYGVDVSNWQGEIHWEQVVENRPQISFAIVKATQGQNLVDQYFYRNWAHLSKTDLTYGAYHFYIFKDSPQKQARLFIETVPLKPGNLIPVIDLEYNCRDCEDLGVSKSLFIKDLTLFLGIVEQHYGVKPVLYADKYFYDRYLKAQFSNYPSWIADYESKTPESLAAFLSTDPLKGAMWQFTDEGRITGIDGNVDLNCMTTYSLKKMTFK